MCLPNGVRYFCSGILLRQMKWGNMSARMAFAKCQQILLKANRALPFCGSARDDEVYALRRRSVLANSTIAQFHIVCVAVVVTVPKFSSRMLTSFFAAS